MNILVIGGTRFFGIDMVNELLTAGHDVTIATRGKHRIHLGIRLIMVDFIRLRGRK